MASTRLGMIGMDRHGSLLSSSVEGMRSRFERRFGQNDYHPHSLVVVKLAAKDLGLNNPILFVKEETPPSFSFSGLCWPQHGFSTACE